jgi:hypothetical protein
MAPVLKISESEILDELRKSYSAVERPAGFLTIQEMVDGSGTTRNTVTRKLAEWEKSGRLESQTILAERTDGRTQRVKAYRLKPKAKR